MANRSVDVIGMPTDSDLKRRLGLKLEQWRRQREEDGSAEDHPYVYYGLDILEKLFADGCEVNIVEFSQELRIPPGSILRFHYIDACDSIYEYCTSGCINRKGLALPSFQGSFWDK